MKKLLGTMLALFCAQGTAVAGDHPEVFARPDASKIRLTGSFTSTEVDTKFNNGTVSSESDASSAYYLLDTEYGVSKNLAIGLQLATGATANYKGMSDIVFYGKYQFNNFYFEGRFNFSPDKKDDSNTYSGAHNVNAIVGYSFNKNFGAYISYMPSYDYEIKDDSRDYKQGGSLVIAGFYETMMADKKLVAILSHFTTEAGENDGKKVGDDSKYLSLQGQVVLPVSQFEVIPGFAYMKYLGDNDDIEQSIRMINVKLRKDF